MPGPENLTFRTLFTTCKSRSPNNPLPQHSKMGGASNKKRTQDERAARPSKKQKRAEPKQAGSDDEDGQDFQAVNLLDSDEEDIHNAVADDGEPSDDAASSSDESDRPQSKRKAAPTKKSTKKTPAKLETEEDNGSEADDNESDEEDGDDSDLDSEGDEDDAAGRKSNTKSKRNDPTAFSTSISKILSTKLPTSKRADPVLARSASANENAKAAADAALEAKAKRHIRLQKKEALEKGRVKDVLIASRDNRTGEVEGTTSGILETERRLRKVAQRGVVKLFNAVRAAQVKAAEAERGTKKDGIIGLSTKEAKVNEMSKKGFLDLIASGGGGMKKGAVIEES